MRLIDQENAVMESTGRTLHVFEGIVGIRLDGSEGPFSGHDSEPHIDLGTTGAGLRHAELIELADFMIGVWTRYKEEYEMLRDEDVDEINRRADG